VKIKRYIILILLTVIFGQSIDTAWGPCDIRIYQGKIEAVDALESRIIEQAQKMVDEWGRVIVRPLSVYITFSKDDFYKQARGPVPEWGVAVAKQDPDQIIIQAPHVSGISFSRMLEILNHELNHVYLNRIENSETFPSWYKEGMAMRQADEFNLRHRIKISKAKWNRQLFTFNDLEHFMNVRKSNANLAYAQSAAMVYALEYYYGDEIHTTLLKSMREGASFWNAIRKITGDERIDVRLNLEIYIEDNYNWMFLLNASNVVFMILPLILIGGFFYKRHRNKKVLAKWAVEELLEEINDQD